MPAEGAGGAGGGSGNGGGAAGAAGGVGQREGGGAYCGAARPRTRRARGHTAHAFPATHSTPHPHAHTTLTLPYLPHTHTHAPPPPPPLQIWGQAGVGYATAALTFLTLFFGEIVPKSLAVANAELVARATLPMIHIVAKVIVD